MFFIVVEEKYEFIYYRPWLCEPNLESGCSYHTDKLEYVCSSLCLPIALDLYSVQAQTEALQPVGGL